MFNVELQPIILVNSTDYEGKWGEEVKSYPYVSVHREREGSEQRKIVWEKGEMHLPSNFEFTSIGGTKFIEYTGNEAQRGNERYFGGGIFIALKS